MNFHKQLRASSCQRRLGECKAAFLSWLITAHLNQAAGLVCVLLWKSLQEPLRSSERQALSSPARPLIGLDAMSFCAQNHGNSQTELRIFLFCFWYT